MTDRSEEPIDTAAAVQRFHEMWLVRDIEAYLRESDQVVADD